VKLYWEGYQLIRGDWGHEEDINFSNFVMLLSHTGTDPVSSPRKGNILPIK